MLPKHLQKSGDNRLINCNLLDYMVQKKAQQNNMVIILHQYNYACNTYTYLLLYF